ncbi:gamma-glutamyl-gamma-aminobutyrate hydrolase family protein [Yaniella flava]|uniref:gamma-glutamyl-gamma-aminobutyrate hydrolase family protein n=1 Tax=Yaniella flava TaxID=287930 RepID=UPI0031DC014A
MTKLVESLPRIAVPAMSANRIQGLRFSGSVVANAVLEAISRAGGLPFIIHPSGDFDSWDQVDAVVVPGGWDIAPELYNQGRHEQLRVSDYEGQDCADIRAINAVEHYDLPALLICRGMQLWNVVRGGTLVQHWPTEPQNHSGTIHDVNVDDSSMLSRVLGRVEHLSVSSVHHQAVDRVGAGLHVVSRAADGCIEALEDSDRNIVAVQWHPEDRASSCDTDQALFDWVVRAAHSHRGNFE